jgi:hypothetical protein
MLPLLAIPAIFLLATGAYPIATAAGRRRFVERDLIHRTRGCHYDSIVGRFLGRTAAGEALHEVYLKPSRGIFLNLSVADWRKLLEPDPAYVYFSLADAPSFAAAINVNLIGRSEDEKASNPLTITVSGADILAACGGRLFHRLVDGTVAVHGEYRGPGRVSPSRHSAGP